MRQHMHKETQVRRVHQASTDQPVQLVHQAEMVTQVGPVHLVHQVHPVQLAKA